MSNLNTDTRMTKEMFDAMWNPRRPLAGDEKGTAYPMSRAQAKEKRYIQTHPRGAKKLICLDYDFDGESDWIIKAQVEDGIIPEPNWITTNPLNGHSQAVFVIEDSVSTPAGILWFDNTFTSLKIETGSDLGYLGHKMKNPLHPAQVTEWMRAEPFTLRELAAFTKPLPTHFYTKKNQLPEIGRNNIMFNKLSAWAYREWRKPKFETRLLVEAQRINMEFDEELPLREIVSIANSIERFVKAHFSEAKFSAIQKARANKRWQGQGKQTTQMLLDMVEAGLTVQEISEQRGKSVTSTYKAIQRAKKA